MKRKFLSLILVLLFTMSTSIFSFATDDPSPQSIQPIKDTTLIINK